MNPGYNGCVDRNRNAAVRLGELLFVAVVGGALALGVAALLGKLGSKTTISQVTPLAQGGGLGSVPLQSVSTKGLTPEQVYRRDATGVVQITSSARVTLDQSRVFQPAWSPRRVASPAVLTMSFFWPRSTTT